MRLLVHTIWITMLLNLFPLLASGQLTKIMGSVKDANTGEPIPFANVYFLNTTIGVSAGFEGEFAFEVDVLTDTLVASALGYENGYQKIRKGVFQKVEFFLNPSQVSLLEVEVFAESDPALIIFNKIIENKAENDPEEFEFLEYRLYNKIQVDANNVNDRFQDSRFFKKFQVVFDYVDTSTINGKAYLPLFFTESVSRVYKRANPKGTREIIMASQLSGYENESMSQFMGGLYQEFNIYDNYISVFQKNFISPISQNAWGTYDYVVLDTLELNRKNCFHIKFKPKRKQQLTFVGEMWIHDSTFAVAKVDMKAAVDANINYINDIAIGLEYEIVKGNWVLSKDKIVLDLNIIENNMKVPGFFTSRTSFYSDFVFNIPPPDSIFSSPVNILVLNDIIKEPSYWETNRDVPLSKNESGIYEMVDSVKNIPLFRTYEDAVYMFTSGYLKWGKFEYGPTYKAISFNTREGLRLRFGGRSSNSFSTRIMLHGYLAYGFKDQQIKGGGGFLYMLKKNPYRKFGADFKYDLEQLGQREDGFSNDNFITSLFRRIPNDKLSMVEGYKLFYDHEWFNGFSTKFTFNQRKIFPVGDLVFEIWDGDSFEMVNAIRTSEVSLKLRFAYQEKYIMGEFERINLGTKYPVLELNATYGIPGLFAANQEYFRMSFQIKQWFNIFNMGWSKYILETGRIWGTVPYPLLEIAPGNQTLIRDQYAFNLMNFYEFINDQYFSLFYEHHFDGFFFNRIPLLRKLKWREVVHAKGIIGNISEKNANFSVFPPYSYSLSRPYYEAGVGIENIFKILRIDFIWRLNHHDHPGTQKFGIFGSLHFSF
jgi:hypothetical protein